MAKLIEFQFIIRNAADSADAFEATSVRGGTNPYITAPPTGDGASFDPNTGVVTSGSYTVRIADPITSGTDRLISSLLEDANGRQQLGHRRAYIKFREDGGAWNVLYCGRVSRYATLSDIEWEFEVSDWMRSENEVSVFHPPGSTTIADFLSDWPQRGCLVGGPIIGGWRNLPDHKGWICRVKAATARLGSPTVYRLEPVSAYGPGAWLPGSDVFSNDKNQGNTSSAGRINAMAHDLSRGPWVFEEREFTTIQHTLDATFWPGLVTLIDGEPWRPIPPLAANIVYPVDHFLNHHFDLISGKVGQQGLLVMQDDQADLTLNALVRVRVLTIRPSEVSPLYFEGHHVDWIAAIQGEAGIPYDAITQKTVRDAVGSPLYFAGQFTKAEKVGPLLEATSYGPIGIGTRMGTDGEVEFFTMRRFSQSLPAVTIDEDDVVDRTTRAFALSTREAVKSFRVGFKLFQNELGGDAADGVQFADYRYERESADPGAIGTGEVGFDVPGMLYIANTSEDDTPKRLDADASLIFDRYGRGPIRLATTLLPTGAGANVKLGDEILVDLPQVPNANKRLNDAAVSARAMQIVHLSRTLSGIEIECIDSGPNASPHGTVPTITMALTTDRPRNTATFTITNAATLNGQSAACRVQIAVDIGGGAPAAEDYSDVAYFDPGTIPTDPVRLPSVTHDCTVYVRARAEKPFSARPSNWSSTANQALDALDAPTSVTGTPSGTDKSQAAATWTIGADSDDALVEVWLSLGSETFADAEMIVTLPAGSDRYTIYYEFAASTEYTVYVRHRDQITGDLSAEASDDFTTGATTVTLAAPTNPYGFSMPGLLGGSRARTFGLQPDFREGSSRYGIVVKATEFPGYVEVQEAVEDSAGAGTYGSYATVAERIPSVSGDWTAWTNDAPSNGLRRKLKARHVRDAATASSYTSEVVVTPGANSPIPQFPLNNLITTALVDSDDRVLDSSQRFRCKLSQTTTALANLTTSTVSGYTEVSDVGALHDTGSNTNRITIPTGGDKGFWLLKARILITGATAGDTFSCSINPSAGTADGAFVIAAGSSSSVLMMALVPAPAVGTYYDVTIASTCVGTPNASTSFEAFHLF